VSEQDPAGRTPEAAQAIIARAAERARTMGLAYAGAVTPSEAHALTEAGAARIVDVRTPEEYRDVGHIADTPLVVWPRSGEPEEVRRFVEEVSGKYETTEPLLLLCRSGVRSHYAAHVLAQAGFGHAYNVLEGFEGAVPGQGWRAAGLPWKGPGSG
jgi:rhodanese-related sulfurtransferase